MPLRRRRPVLRAAAVGGGAYLMGKRRAEAQQQAPPAAEGGSPSASPEPAGGLDADAVKRLKELADLHEQGVLTDEEFAEQKARILG
ncbi:MAG TPA: SHOCT domain-containing protein [Solirubrobacteraceae bacterium]|jgi:hypothetical protein|nr:SHOCT domain-containing protein [Solirubrobacteraceae bacterium]